MPGNLVGEGETQIFLATAERRPGVADRRAPARQAPRWGVSLVAKSSTRRHARRSRDTLAWYRLACFLPAAAAARRQPVAGRRTRARAAEDYRLSCGQLGACPRTLAADSIALSSPRHRALPRQRGATGSRRQHGRTAAHRARRARHGRGRRDPAARDQRRADRAPRRAARSHRRGQRARPRPSDRGVDLSPLRLGRRHDRDGRARRCRRGGRTGRRRRRPGADAGAQRDRAAARRWSPPTRR